MKKLQKRLIAALDEMIRIDEIGQQPVHHAFNVQLKTEGSSIELVSYTTKGAAESARTYFINQIADRIFAKIEAMER
jgi:hypothetical protein